jgi:integrase
VGGCQPQWLHGADQADEGVQRAPVASADDLIRAWNSAIKAAKIKRLTPHSCRHGFATGLLRKGVDVVTVAKLGGWRTPAQVLKTYGHAIDNRRLTDLLIDGKLTRDQIDIAESLLKSSAS